MPFGWSACARYTGIRSPPSGHRQPLYWALIAHNAGNECPNIGLIFGQYSFDSLRYLKRLNWLFAYFVLSLMILRKRLRVYTIVDFSFIRTFAPSF